MKYIIEHEIKGRMRIHVCQKRMSFREADILQFYLTKCPAVISAKVSERTQNAVIRYSGDRADIIKALRSFSYKKTEVPESYLQNSGRELNRKYWDKLVNSVLIHLGKKLFLPTPVRSAVTAANSVKYIWHGIQTLAAGKIEVPVLDGTAIGVSVLRGDMNTAASVMFLLGIGEILEDWTHKKSVGDLARGMSLRVEKVWLKTEDTEILVDSGEVEPGDSVKVHMGNVIPFDGTVEEGEAMVNQASLTGESQPAAKRAGSFVYAGTVVEEGELVFQVKETSGSTKFEKIITMIEETEKLKSSVESRAEHLAEMALDRLQEKGTVALDDVQRATLVSNLLVVLCGNRDVQPIINSGQKE